MNVCCSINKYVLFIFNFLFAIGGLVLLIVGSILEWNLNYYGASVFEGSQHAAAIVLITAGCIIFVISFCGCVGAIRESSCLLYTYATLVTLTAILLIAGTVLAFISADRADEMLATSLEKLKQDYNDGNEAAQNTVNVIQDSLHCCGIEDANDYVNIPDSCRCSPGDFMCGDDSLYSRGCYDIMLELFLLFEYILAGVSLGFAVIAIIAVFLACCLTGAKKSRGLNI